MEKKYVGENTKTFIRTLKKFENIRKYIQEP